MTQAQKVIKYLALALAIFLIVSIFSAIISGVVALSAILGLKRSSEDRVLENIQELSIQNYENIKSLEIDIISSNITIKKGEKLAIETNNKNITTSTKANKLEIKEEKKSWFFTESTELVIYVPEDLIFEEIEIENGTGKVEIDTLKTNELKIELGVGETKIDNLEVYEKCRIKNGVGTLTISSGNLTNLNLEMGVGDVTITAKLLDKSSINSGIGELQVELLGKEEDYTIKVSKGLGKIKVDGKEASDDDVIGNGDNTINIKGGIGNVTVDFE